MAEEFIPRGVPSTERTRPINYKRFDGLPPTPLKTWDKPARKEKPEPVTVDTPDAAVLVNTAREGPTVYPEIDALADELEAARKRIAELEGKLALADFPQSLPPDPSTKMSDYVPAEIRSLMEEGESLSSAKRRLTELLWVEQAELRNLRGTDRENLKREAEIERLLGLFARLGEI